MSILYLSKQGYGTPREIREWDTKEFLDAIEYEEIGNSIMRHLKWESEKNI